MEFRKVVVDGKPFRSRVECVDDPEIWVQRFLPDMRNDIPLSFVVHVDNQMFGFSVGGSAWDDEYLPDGTAHQVVIVSVGGKVSGSAYPIERLLICPARKFANRAQQYRVFEVLLASGPALFEDDAGLSDFVLAPNVQRDIESGAYLDHDPLV